MNIYEGKRGLIIEADTYPQQSIGSQSQIALNWDHAAELYRQLRKWEPYFENRISPAELWNLADKRSEEV